MTQKPSTIKQRQLSIVNQPVAQITRQYVQLTSHNKTAINRQIVILWQQLLLSDLLAICY